MRRLLGLETLESKMDGKPWKGRKLEDLLTREGTGSISWWRSNASCVVDPCMIVSSLLFFMETTAKLSNSLLLQDQLNMQA